MNFFKINIPKSIIPLLIFAVTLNILRIVIWGKFSFVYILWNIFLSFVPFLISSILLNYSKINKLSKTFFITSVFLWLLFIPNAHYIITDLIHLGEVKYAPVIYDTLLLFSSALVGLLFGLYSLSHMEQIIEDRFSKKVASISMLVIFLLIGFGIYIGRFMRFNSWDFFSNHVSILNSFYEIFSNKALYIEVFIYTILFASFVYASYKSWKYINSR